jgi:GT2 family glycosyltransferase
MKPACAMSPRVDAIRISVRCWPRCSGPRRPLAPKLGVAVDETRTLQAVDAVSGALMLVSRDLFERLGGFDAGYRLHAEDLDLCRRARQANALVAVANDVRVVHIRGVSSRSRPLFVEWHKHRGLWRYFRRFEAPRRGALTRLAVFADDLVALSIRHDEGVAARLNP